MADEEVAALESVVGLALLSDERVATPAARRANEWELGDLLAGQFETRTTSEWVQELRAAGVPVAEPKPYNNELFLRDPANRRTGRVAEVPHPRDGHVRELAILIRVSDASIREHRVAPGLGEHTDDILEAMGFSPDAIATLRARGAVR